MARVKPSHIERPKKLGRIRETIHELDDNMAKHSIAPQADGTDKYLLLPTQQTIYAEAADGSSKYVPVWASDVRTHRQSEFQTIIEMFPPGSICRIYLYDIGTVQAVIHGIKFSTNDYLGPALHIEFFNLKDVFALSAETSPDTLSQYPIMQSCVIYNLGQIESIDSSDAAEMCRELIKNEMLAIKKQIAALKDNLRRLSRLRNSRDSTSGLVSEIHRKYHTLIRNFRK